MRVDRFYHIDRISVGVENRSRDVYCETEIAESADTKIIQSLFTYIFSQIRTKIISKNISELKRIIHIHYLKAL